MRRRTWSIPGAGVLLLVGCSTLPPMPDPSPSHPASPAAADGPASAPSETLRPIIPGTPSAPEGSPAETGR